jgi:hypothetical protein
MCPGGVAGELRPVRGETVGLLGDLERRTVPYVLGGVPAGLIQMKAWAGRTQDLADCQRLQDLDR